MTNDEFLTGYNRMTSVFTVTKERERAKVYYERLKRYSGTKWEMAVVKILDTSPRFPSIANLKELMNNIDEGSERSSGCNVCEGGSGFKKLGVLMYRAPCKHGYRISKDVKMYPITQYEQDKELYEQEQEMILTYGEKYKFPREKDLHT